MLRPMSKIHYFYLALNLLKTRFWPFWASLQIVINIQHVTDKSATQSETLSLWGCKKQTLGQKSIMFPKRLKTFLLLITCSRQRQDRSNGIWALCHKNWWHWNLKWHLQARSVSDWELHQRSSTLMLLSVSKSSLQSSTNKSTTKNSQANIT